MVKIIQYCDINQFKKIKPIFNDISNFKVSKYKISYINFRLVYPNFGLSSNSFAASWIRKKADRYFFHRWWKVFPKLMGLRVGVYIGNKFHSFRVHREATGLYLGFFIRTRKAPINLRFKKKNVYRSKKNMPVSGNNKSSVIKKKQVKKKLFFKIMRSFSAVSNFRSTLNVRWKQFGYSFEASGSLFNWANICFANRVIKPSRVLSKVGIYFSHFIFSDSCYNPSSLFFFDLYFDRKYTRFSNLIFKVFKINKKFINTKSKGIIQKNKRFNSSKLQLFFSIISKSNKLLNIKFIFSSFKYLSNKYFFKYKIAFSDRFNFIKFSQFFKVLIIFSGFSNNSGHSPKILINLKRLMLKRVTKPFINYRIKAQFRRVNNRRFVFQPNNFLQPDFFFKSSVNKFISARLRRSKWKKLAWVLFRDTRININKIQKDRVRPFYIKFKVMLLGSIRFFLSYYFKYNPIRFVSFLGIYKKFFQEKFKYLFLHVGWKFCYMKFLKRSVFVWFLKSVYSQFLRNNLFFLVKNRYQCGKSYFGSAKVNFNSLSGFGVIPASLISRIFTFRLRRRERLNPVLYSLVRLVLARKKILGLTISKAGRFTKRQRTARSITRFGRASFNSFIMPIDYSFSTAILKYSMVSIKIWISFLPPVNFFFYKPISSNFVYPTIFQSFKNLNYLYIWSVSKSLSLYAYNRSSRFNIGLEKVKFFRSGFFFISGWNFFYFRSYRRFSKYFSFSSSFKKRISGLNFLRIFFFLLIFFTLYIYIYT